MKKRILTKKLFVAALTVAAVLSTTGCFIGQEVGSYFVSDLLDLVPSGLLERYLAYKNGDMVSDEQKGEKETETAGKLTTEKETTEENTTAEENSDAEAEITAAVADSTGLPVGLKAKKIGSFSGDYIFYDGIGDVGICYHTQSGKYGILSLDGSQDTGPIYAYARQNESYFDVLSALPGENTDALSQNVVGLVDVTGKELIPASYAKIDVLNDRYASVIEVTGVTESLDNAILYNTDHWFTIGPQEGDTVYAGNWYIYDLKTGEKVSGLTGTSSTVVTAYGDYLRYPTGDGRYKTVAPDGRELPEGAKIMEEGYYTLENVSEGTLYDDQDNKLFSYKTSDFVPYRYKEGCFLCKKSADGNKVYAVMDMSGNVISAEFNNDNFKIYGSFIVSADDEIFDFSGTRLTDKSFSYIKYTDQFGFEALFLERSDMLAIIDKNGTVVYESENADNYTHSNQIPRRWDENNNWFCYSFKDKDFTIPGTNLSAVPWLIDSSAQAAVYDPFSGQALIEGENNTDFTAAVGDKRTIYVYADPARGDTEVYAVTLP